MLCIAEAMGFDAIDFPSSGHHQLVWVIVIPTADMSFFCYTALNGLLTTKFAGPISGHLVNISAGNSEGFTAGSIAFLVLNAFLIILGKSQYHMWSFIEGYLGSDH